MSRPLWFVQLIKKTFPGRFLAARATRLPVVGSVIDHMLFEGDDLIYLPRDKSIKIDRSIAPQTEMVLPSQVVEHFIEQAGYHWIMNTASAATQENVRTILLIWGVCSLAMRQWASTQNLATT